MTDNILGEESQIYREGITDLLQVTDNIYHIKVVSSVYMTVHSLALLPVFQ
jgi:hypothetical protein